MRAAIHWLLAGMLGWISAGAAAQIFECIDAGGKLEFAQKCSPGTIRQREVAKSGTGSLDGAAPPQTSYKEEEQAFRRRQYEREAEEKKERTTAAAAEKKCAAARSRLLSLENARRLRSGNDPQTGQPHYLDDNERVAAVQQARDNMSANCR